jgi:hypothetical protein
MADKKISQLSDASTPLAGTEVLPIVQSGSTVKVATDNLTVKNVRSNATSGILQIAGPAAAATRTMTVPDANFTAARTDAAQSFTGDQTLATGNLIQGTAAKGFEFSANTAAAGMTSELLNWYEEGTWTPVGNGISLSTATGHYTRIGRIVHISAYVVFPAQSDGNLALFTGLPFTPANTEAAVGNCTVSNTDYGAALYGRVAANLPRWYFSDSSGNLLTNANLSGKYAYFGGSYSV